MLAYLQVELVGGIGGVEQEVELELVVLSPVLLACHNHLLGAHLQGIILLARAVRQSIGLASEGVGEHDGEVSKTTTARY